MGTEQQEGDRKRRRLGSYGPWPDRSGAGEEPDPPPGSRPARTQRSHYQPIEELRCSYYFRFSAVDRPGVLSKISGILGEKQYQHLFGDSERKGIGGLSPVVMLTHEAKESSVRPSALSDGATGGAHRQNSDDPGGSKQIKSRKG